MRDLMTMGEEEIGDAAIAGGWSTDFVVRNGFVRWERSDGLVREGIVPSILPEPLRQAAIAHEVAMLASECPLCGASLESMTVEESTAPGVTEVSRAVMRPVIEIGDDELEVAMRGEVAEVMGIPHDVDCPATLQSISSRMAQAGAN